MSALRAFGLLLRWRLLQMRPVLPLLVTIQTLLAVGVVVGLAFLVPGIDTTSAIYLSTGAPTIALLILGLTVVPQEVAQMRASGGQEWLRTLPVPRLAHVGAEITTWFLVQIPGTVLALVVAALRFHFALHPGPLVVPAFLAVAVTSAAIGYGLAQALPLAVVQPLTSVLSIAILLFSPVDFPADRLPAALRDVHAVLPIASMADVVRASLTGETAALRAWLVVAAWAVAALALCRRLSSLRG